MYRRAEMERDNPVFIDAIKTHRFVQPRSKHPTKISTDGTGGEDGRHELPNSQVHKTRKWKQIISRIIPQLETKCCHKHKANKQEKKKKRQNPQGKKTSVSVGHWNIMDYLQQKQIIIFLTDSVFQVVSKLLITFRKLESLAWSRQIKPSKIIIKLLIR